MREGERLEPAVVSTWQTRAVTLWGRWPRFSSSESRTCQEKIKFQAFQVTTSWETTRLAMQAAGGGENAKRSVTATLSSSGRRGQQHRKLEEGNAAAERVVPIFIELQLTLKYFPAKRPCWTGVGRRLAGLWIQDGRPGSSSAVALRGKPAAVTGRRVGARAQPSQAGRQRPTQTPSNITRLSTITDTHLHSFQS